MTVGEIDRIRDLLGVDLSMPHEPVPPKKGDERHDERKLGVRLMEDPVLLARVVYHMTVVPDVRTAVPSDDGAWRAFLDGLDGEHTASMSEAFFAELADFFRLFRPHVSQWLESLIAALRPESSSSTAAESSADSTRTDGHSVS